MTLLLRQVETSSHRTDSTFATDSGFDRGYISGLERGVRNPSVLVLERIAKALDVDVAELMDPKQAELFSRARS